MKLIVATVALLITLVAAPTVHAKGCIKGAVVGGVAGHYAAHHGLLGAAAGCVIGRHEAKKRAREDAEQRNQIGLGGNDEYK
jgi:outer membrane lipoprotein SlyB